ncbi:hypothetical protein GCM10017774_03200 [Lentzea cavernae]|uniref:Uncharacterized protein n=1 Tax=Lentzea cavernae TaxID=2020703 RepID=A0ABQ3M783_9PSEU|nr:hypothetical protein GCM10017774_03200 [Lentzea cavernae]
MGNWGGLASTGIETVTLRASLEPVVMMALASGKLTVVVPKEELLTNTSNFASANSDLMTPS